MDGELVTGNGPEFNVVDPATGESHSTLHSATETQLSRAPTAARNAQPTWRSLSQPDRSRSLHEVADRILVEGERVAEALTHERPSHRSIRLGA